MDRRLRLRFRDRDIGTCGSASSVGNVGEGGEKGTLVPRTTGRNRIPGSGLSELVRGEGVGSVQIVGDWMLPGLFWVFSILCKSDCYCHFRAEWSTTKVTDGPA